jgi:putative molybdopterin biosynthesis protein
VAAAARALGLDFVPIASESYELAMPITFADSELAAPLFRLMADNSFKESIAQVPGYNTSKMGSISFEGTP